MSSRPQVPQWRQHRVLGHPLGVLRVRRQLALRVRPQLVLRVRPQLVRRVQSRALGTA